MKLQELEDYDLEVRGTPATQQGLNFWPEEQEIIDFYDDHLRRNPGTLFTSYLRSDAVTTRLGALRRSARGQNLNPEQLGRLQDNLQQAGNVALLYPLILEDRLELLLVTQSELVRTSVPVS